MPYNKDSARSASKTFENVTQQRFEVWWRSLNYALYHNPDPAALPPPNHYTPKGKGAVIDYVYDPGAKALTINVLHCSPMEDAETDWLEMLKDLIPEDAPMVLTQANPHMSMGMRSVEAMDAVHTEGDKKLPAPKEKEQPKPGDEALKTPPATPSPMNAWQPPGEPVPETSAINTVDTHETIGRG